MSLSALVSYGSNSSESEAESVAAVAVADDKAETDSSAGAPIANSNNVAHVAKETAENIRIRISELNKRLESAPGSMQREYDPSVAEKSAKSIAHFQQLNENLIHVSCVIEATFYMLWYNVL